MPNDLFDILPSSSNVIKMRHSVNANESLCLTSFAAKKTSSYDILLDMWASEVASTIFNGVE
jgi:hypothetical protein